MRLGLGLGLFKAGLISAGVRIFSAFQTRVIGDGGTVEAGTCVVNGINGSALLQQASLLLIPSGYKGGKLYAEIPTNGNGDLTWTRGSDAFRTNASGLLQRVPWNLVQYSEQFDNASWTKTNATITANATTSPDGTTNADKLVENTSAGFHKALQVISGFVGTTVTYSVYLKAAERTWGLVWFDGDVAGAYVNLSTGALGTVSSGVTASVINVGDGWYRCVVTRTIVSSANIAVYPATGNGGASYTGDGTSGIYIWGAQLEAGTTAQTYLPTTDRLNFPRLDYTYGSCPSALLEPQRTNSIRNSTMQGAVTGSPGTLPTNWLNLVTAGLTRSIAGVGIENGIPYVDIRFNGTANASTVRVDFDGATAIPALNAQVWTNSIYAKIVSAPNPPLSYVLQIIERSSAGGYVTEGSQNFTPTTSLQRFAFTRTLNGGGTVANAQPCISINLTNGATYDFTIRIASPQMELGAFATTWINTTNAAATRVADSFSRNNIYTNGLISASGGTWFVELRGNVSYVRDAGSEGLFIGDTSVGTTNCLQISSPIGGGRLRILKRVAGTGTELYSTLTDTIKVAIKWNGTSADVFVNGTKRVSATAYTTTTMEFLGGLSADAPKFIQQMALFSTPLSDTDCTTITSI